MPNPRLSVVVLTWNEERNIVACLESLARQTASSAATTAGSKAQAFEVLVIDAGSTDRTVALVEAARKRLPFPMHLRVGPTRMPIGEARNLGVTLAQAPN